MKVLLNNPFPVSGYYGSAYFCDREIETEKIISALVNERNISLISPRRMGKTGLIHHVFEHLQERYKDAHCFYLDIFSTQNLHDFVLLLANTVLGKLDNYSETMLKHIASFFKSLRPVITFDELTGNPALTLNMQPEQSEKGLEEIFEYMKHSGKICFIAIDEFQQILEYPEQGIEALLRSYTQFLPNIKFIFSGSKKHLMDVMFSSHNRPFYQSAQKIGLKEIPVDIYQKFAVSKFEEHNKILPFSVFDRIYNQLMGHTWYIQFVLNQLFALSQTNYNEMDVAEVIRETLQEENATYKTYCEMLTKGQLRLLRAIAKEHKMSNPYSACFLKKHNLTAVSSVKLALSALIDKMLVLKDDEDKYYVYDRFFSLWLEEN